MSKPASAEQRTLRVAAALALALAAAGCRWKDESPPHPLPSAPISFAPLVKRLLPAMVGVYATSRQAEQSLGSGIILSPDGLILTNEHVVSSHGPILVRFFDGHRVPAQLVGTDEEIDLALLKVDPPAGRPLPTAPLGDSDRIEIGDWVIAVGQPYGLSHSVTAGIISGKGRTALDMQAEPHGHGYWYYLQTDAAINPGNSGGPLIDMNGQVVGINTMIHQEQHITRVGFAIPISLAKIVIPQLKQHGSFERAWIGVEPESLEPDDESAHGVPGGRGVLVRAVRPESPAARAGLHAGDVIYRFDGRAVTSDAELRWLASTAGPGRTIAVTIWRASRSEEIMVHMERKPADVGIP
jgi:serine protease Do